MTDNPQQALGGVIAYLTVEGAIKASEFYQKALGATHVHTHPPDEQGRTMHVHLHINGSSVMLGDPYPEHGCGHAAAAGFSLMLVVDDIEAWWKRAIDAGATPVMPPADMFWGDRYGQLRDPYGILWAMNQQKKA